MNIQNPESGTDLPDDGDEYAFIDTEPAREALAMMHEVYRDPKGLGLFTGLPGSGRRVIVNRFTAELRRRDTSAVAVDGNGMDRAMLLRAVLVEIGYELDEVAVDDLSGMLRVFLVHQCHAGQPVFLAFFNVGRMHPSALREICRLAELTACEEAAARILLVGDGRLRNIVNAPAMEVVRERATARYDLSPSTPAGNTGLRPATRIIVSLDGRVLDERPWKPGRILVGRDPHNDIRLQSRYASRHHALLIVEEERAWIVDLKSMNGTLVNSRRVSQHPLRHEDIVSIGNHRLKYINPAAIQASGEESLAKTTVMRSLQEGGQLFTAATGEPDREDTLIHGLPADSGGTD